MSQTVRDVMTRAPITVAPTASAGQVAELMRDADVGVVLVTDGLELKGLITDRDLVVRVLARGRGPLDEIGGACSSELTFVSPEDDVATAIDLMRTRAIRRLPVLEDGQPVGIVSIGDLAVSLGGGSVLGDISEAPSNW
ncbi:MAG TPA: CBS domain-containing protein [Actinocrinis sp.]|jgi:CBS domain-containing protein